MKNQNKNYLRFAIILATDKYINTDLLSNDWDDFRNIDFSVNVSDIEDLKGFGSNDISNSGKMSV